MVKRNTTYDFNFYVITDQVDRYTEPHFIPIEPISADVGWWVKLQMYSKELLPPGEYLYCDLDVIIVDNIDELFDHKPFGIIRDFIRPDEGILPGKEYNSSVVKFDNRTTDGIWQYYIQNKKQWVGYQKDVHFFGDQNVVSSYLNFYPDYVTPFPDEWLWSLRKGVKRGATAGDRSRWFGRNIPEGGKICVCHGEPSPQEILDTPQKWANKRYLSNECLEWVTEHYQ